MTNDDWKPMMTIRKALRMGRTRKVMSKAQQVWNWRICHMQKILVSQEQ